VIKSAATCCDAGRFISVIVKGRCTGQKVDETTQPSVERMRASRGTATFFHWPRRIGSVGPGGWQEQVELGSGLRHEQEGRESRGKKGGRELMEKRRGMSASLYLAKGRAGR
jgi:hypothetical protein